MKVIRFAIFVSVSFAFAGGVLAGDIPGYPDDVTGYDPREVALLPPFCPYTAEFRNHVPGGDNRAEMDRWYATMGPGFGAMHHYCWGLMKTNRALLLARTPQSKRFYLGASIGEFDYVITNVQPDFVMLPEILTRKGQNLIRLGKNREGLEQLQRAIELKSDYWPPYAALSDYYKSQGDLAKARGFLEKALAIAPDAKPLTTRLAELDSANTTKKPAKKAPADSN
jgi:tetratricopeptide (TPR) repeat protein